MNDKFSWKRFGLFVRAELSGECRSLLLKLGGFVVFCIVMYMLWNVKVIFGGGQVGYNGGLSYVTSRFFVLVGMGFIVYFNLSGSFKRYFSKGRASAALMLPAARSEKFLYALLLNLVAIPLVLIALALLNDVMWAGLLGFDNICRALSSFFARVHTPAEEMLISAWSVTANLVSTFSGMAFFFLGAVVFRRYHFLLTVLASFILSIPSFVYVQYTAMTDPVIMRDFILWLGSDAGVGTIMACGGFFTFLWIFVAWRRFSTLQITR